MSLGDKLRRAVKEQPKKDWKVRPEILLHPNIPKPLHGVAPRVILGSTWWNKTRQESYASTDFHCAACGTHRTLVKGSRKHLEGHELYEINYAKGRLTYVETVPLCPYCHSYIHDGRLRSLVQLGKMHASKLIAVIQHGDQVLKRAGLRKPTHQEREEQFRLLVVSNRTADWGDWRLVLNGKLYKPKYKTYEEWELAMSKFNDMED